MPKNSAVRYRARLPAGLWMLTELPTDKLAFSIDELGDHGGPHKTKAYEEIRNGRLRARKLGSRTLILATDFRQYLESLPPLGEDS